MFQKGKLAILMQPWMLEVT